VDTFIRDFTESAFSEKPPFQRTSEILSILAKKSLEDRSSIEEIPFDRLRNWTFDADRGCLRHESGKFFSIEGIRVRTNSGSVGEWEQPIISQPEIGILGILAKKIDGILYFLMQAKIEPGNINRYQIAPTVQATKSNYTQVHKGSLPDYIEYFLSPNNSLVMLDILQSEQGARFLKKRNRNMIVQVREEIPVKPNFFWLTLGQISRLLERDNIVNMDARSVISCISYCGSDLCDKATLKNAYLQGAILDAGISSDIIKSLQATSSGLNTNDGIIGWFTRQKVKYELEIERIPLQTLKGWKNDGWKIHHELMKYFSVVAIDVEIQGREVSAWTQPIIKPCEPGIVAFVAKKINGLMHFLVQAKVEPGNFDVVEMAPTVQCITGSYKEDSPDSRPAFLDYVLEAPSRRRLIDSMQSEEGGRFLREQNQNIIVMAEDDFDVNVPDNFIWMTLGQIKEFIKYNNFVNVEARCLAAILSLLLRESNG